MMTYLPVASLTSLNTHAHTDPTLLSLCTHPALELDAQPLHIKGKPCVVRKEVRNIQEGEKIVRGEHEVSVWGHSNANIWAVEIPFWPGCGGGMWPGGEYASLPLFHSNLRRFIAHVSTGRIRVWYVTVPSSARSQFSKHCYNHARDARAKGVVRWSNSVPSE